MYIPRALASTLGRSLDGFPAVLVTGPRQSGKTTLVQQELGQDRVYVSLDDPLESDLARHDPRGFVDRFGDRDVILDEVQYAPDLLSEVKLRIDGARGRMGRWVLTGSQQFALMAGVGESLAGRVAVLELLPLSLNELSKWRPATLSEAIWHGGYPDPVTRPDHRDLWLSSYLRTYVERDVRSLLRVTDLAAFEMFLGLVAARHGQEVRYATLARDVGISQPTAKAWHGVLKASYLLFELPPWSRNYGKRIVRSAKAYLLDSALACALTRQPGAEAAVAGAMGGALFEGLVVAEMVKAFANRGRRPPLHFWRSQDGLEVDLLIDLGGKVVPVEIKLTSTPRAGHVRPMERFLGLAGADVADTGVVVCRVDERRPLPGGHLALPWQEIGAWTDELLSR